MPKRRIAKQSLCPIYPVTNACRTFLLETFPALRSGKDAQAYRALAGYFLFSSFYDEDSGYLVFPYEMVADHVGSHPKERYFNASAWLHYFGNEVWEIVPHSPDYKNGKATELYAHPDREILAQISALNLQTSGDDSSLSGGLVDLVTGALYSRRNQDKLEANMRHKIEVPTNHPAKQFADFLNTQPQTAFKSLVQRNWTRAVDCYHAMPEDSVAANRRKAYAQAALSRVRLIQRQYYTGKMGTQRLYAISPSIHELPRELRKELLHGCVFLDARSIQLAIVSRLWDMPVTRAFLERGGRDGSVWLDVQAHMGIGPEWKPFIKEALYSVLFGRSIDDLRFYLGTGRQPSQRGRDFDPEPGPFALETQDRIDRFLAHRIIAECVAAQERRILAIKASGHIIEASGLKRVIDSANNIDAKSLLAAEVQSWEMALMSKMLTVLDRYKETVKVMSFLHDGLALWFSDSRREVFIIDKLKSEFISHAQDSEFPTYLEHE